MKNPKMTGFAKMLVDQLLMAPVFLANFIAVNSILQGNPWSKVKSDVTSNYKDILITNYQVIFLTVPILIMSIRKMMYDFTESNLNYFFCFISDMATSTTSQF